jgi:tRNA(fMet)-specific endonuclease VapC
VEVNLLLDTNRLTDALRGDPGVVLTLENAVLIRIPFIALAEMRAGFLCGQRPRDNEAALNKFLSLPGVDVLFADRGTVEIYARLFAYLRAAGTPVPTNDIWIASLAVQHRLALLTRDAHFQKLPQVVQA